MISMLGVDETAERCDSFFILPKPNVTVCLWLKPTRLNQALIRPVHRDLTMNDILAKGTNLHYMTFINMSSAYPNLKLDKMSSYLHRFACQFGRYRSTRLLFRVMAVGDMFQEKMMEYSRAYQMYLILMVVF